MNEGLLQYFMNSKYTGLYYQINKLKTGPIFPAVCMVMNSGCSIFGPL